MTTENLSRRLREQLEDLIYNDEYGYHLTAWEAEKKIEQFFEIYHDRISKANKP